MQEDNQMKKMRLVKKDPNGECCKHAEVCRSFPWTVSYREFIQTDGKIICERDNWNPHDPDFDPYICSEMEKSGWNLDWVGIENATYAVFSLENTVESLLSKQELEKLLPWIEFE